MTSGGWENSINNGQCVTCILSGSFDPKEPKIAFWKGLKILLFLSVNYRDVAYKQIYSIAVVLKCNGESIRIKCLKGSWKGCNSNNKSPAGSS